MLSMTREQFERFAGPAVSGPRAAGTVAIPLAARLLSDQLTPVLAYRRLVAPEQRLAPSFLFESVEGGERQGRYSIMGTNPLLRVVARGCQVTVHHRDDHAPPRALHADDPLTALRTLAADYTLAIPTARDAAAPLPACPLGGWIGYAAYDAARYAEPEKLALDHAPSDDRALPEIDFGLYDAVVVFDHVAKVVHIVALALVPARAAPDQVHAAYQRAADTIHATARAIQRHSKPLPSGFIAPPTAPAPLASNTTRARHAQMVAQALEYIRAGDIFQVVLGQRFERRSAADPFDVYRALRAVNPSPYMVYLQATDCILVASSPEILCRVRRETHPTDPDAPLVLTNRPLAGTRRRGQTPEEDAALEQDLLSDAKEIAEHVMLVDLGRNDVGRVCTPGSIRIPALMQVERYSHVMHISSTVTGTLRPGLDCWDALRATLPVGTISGAPKIRAMQIIDELEPVRRGPYGGGIGWVGLDGQMDIALALRTMVIPTRQASSTPGSWLYHIQAAGGIVADSQPDAEYQETVNKAAALARAIEVAEDAFSQDATPPDQADA